MTKWAKILWINFGFIRETMIRTRYMETPKGKAEQDRLYWQRREAFTRRHARA